MMQKEKSQKCPNFSAMAQIIGKCDIEQQENHRGWTLYLPCSLKYIGAIMSVHVKLFDMWLYFW